jgi:hypothetical protein
MGLHLRLEEREIVREPERTLPPRAKRDARSLLGAEAELVAVDPQLAQDLSERRPLHPRRHEVGDRMQAHVILAAAEAVEAVQAPDGVVALEDADLLAEVRQPYSGGEAGQTGTDDGYVVLRT